ncbi:hypothetical protein DSM104299_00242 [Baekduia alba]|uniref:hypothetical protein n=1 Tax=Baekduia alba TaxID=2997333 RepID=UPI00233FDB22|nr:hypothetical protein [Baekduia alba]WCB91571.1 hypothetical protein DSM104299_00242 [Baekduia alba]
MNRAVAFALLLAASLAGCTGSPTTTVGSTSPGTSQSAATRSASTPPLLTCPTPAAGVSALRVVAVDITMRDQPVRLTDGAVVLGRIQNGQVVELKRVGHGPWRRVACGQKVGWTLAYTDQLGANRRVWLVPVNK